jgi:hypothetical protein
MGNGSIGFKYQKDISIYVHVLWLILQYLGINCLSFRIEINKQMEFIQQKIFFKQIELYFIYITKHVITLKPRIFFYRK